MTTVIASSALCAPGAPAPGWLAIEGTTISEVGTGRAPRGAIDLGDAVLTPGFVDLQCNGVSGVDFAAADADGWQRAGEELARHGVTSYCPTFVSAPLDAYHELLDAAAAEQSRATAARAEVMGVHLEGPFLGAAPGAHRLEHLRPADVGWLVDLVAARPGLLRIVTLAPEADRALEATRALVAAGVVVALGHSTATYDDVTRAVDAGASVVTHLFNGMAPFHHRAPGLVGAALTDGRLTPTVIADLVHLHPVALRIAFACQPEVAVVSDAVGATRGVVARDGAAWLTDGTLAGATALLDTAVANLVAAGIPLPRAIESVTSVPARLLGAGDRGVLRAGARADVVALDPRTLDVVGVWLRGRPSVRDR